MRPDAVFQLANALVLPQWLLMAFLPRWAPTRWVMQTYLVPVCLAVLYALYLFGGGPVNFRAFSSLAGIKALFAHGGDGVMLAGWVHYLAFDLVAGTWVVRDAQEKAIPHWLVVMPLFFCFMLGPVGLLLYWLIRIFRTKTITG